MGRAIDMENRIDDHERRLKLVEDALEELVQTRIHHIDLIDEKDLTIKGIEIASDEEFTPPSGKRKIKKNKMANKEKVKVEESML